MREPVKVIRDILKSELGLTDKRIMLTNSKIDIDPGPGIFIALSYLHSKAFASNNYATPTPAGMQETQEVAMVHHIQVDIMSADESARMQKEQVIQALQSIFAQQAMDANLMNINKLPTEIIDTSSLEETKIMNRYTMNFSLFALHSLNKPLAGGYYDKFPVTVQDDTDTHVESFEAEATPSF
jgi:hypothetical protein